MRSIKTVYKYVLSLGTEDVIQLPKGAKVLSVQNQRNQVCLWALVDPNCTETENRRFILVMTGDSRLAHQLDTADFIGTVLLDGGDFVVHVFEGK